jgi:hypothetical protein
MGPILHCLPKKRRWFSPYYPALASMTPQHSAVEGANKNTIRDGWPFNEKSVLYVGYNQYCIVTKHRKGKIRKQLSFSIL